MSGKSRIIGTTDECINKAERELGFEFPSTFRQWLLENNGRGIDDVTIFPVLDERDPRKTWDSIVRNYKENWLEWTENFDDDFSKLLPFAEEGTGDFFCFDYAQLNSKGEPLVLLWSHEDGSIENLAETFDEFLITDY